MTHRSAALLAVLGLVLGGCGGDPPAAAPGSTGPVSGPVSGSVSGSASGSASPSAPRTIVVTPIPVPPGVHLSFIQQRIDEGTPRAQVRVVNGTHHDLHVRSVGVDWAGFPLRLARSNYDVGAQATIDLFVTLPRAVCTRAAYRSPIDAVAITRHAAVRRPVAADGVRFLHRLWRTDCTARRVANTVDLSYGPTFTERRHRGRLVLDGTLELRRTRRDDAVRVGDVEGSVLFELRTTGSTRLRVGRRHASIPIQVADGGRCDPHSRGQSTQTFLFHAYLRLAGSAPVAVLVEPTRPQQARLLRFLDRACRR